MILAAFFSFNHLIVGKTLRIRKSSKILSLAKGTLKSNLGYEKLYDKTYTKAKKAIGAINAAKFIQLEVYLQTAIRSQILDSIPFIGEIEKSKVN